MGVINANNTLTFKSSEPMFNRIKKRLTSIDTLGLIDSDDFHKHVVYMLQKFGEALFKECQAVLPVCNYKTKLPPNFSRMFAAYKCHPHFKETKSINEQKPLIFYSDVEIGCETSDTKCCIGCAGDSKTKIVVRTFVNGEPTSGDRYYRRPILLKISPNVREHCTDDCLNLMHSGLDEISIVDGEILCNFDDDCIYLQYFGTPLDANGLPMIPANEIIEKAIEYYIYTQLFEELLWNSSIPNMAQILQDARNQFENKYMPDAMYWAKLPSFQAMVNSVRRFRGKNKFYYFLGDKTTSYTDARNYNKFTFRGW